MTPAPMPGSTARVADALEALFISHGIATHRQGNALTFPQHPGMKAMGATFNFDRVTQLDVRLTIEPGRDLIESVAGFGETEEARFSNGIQAFASGSFHVIASGIFGLNPCHYTDLFDWKIGGIKRRVYHGPTTTQFGLPLTTDGKADVRFLRQFEYGLKAQSLPEGIHWVRVYHMQNGTESLANEVLLDNNAWPEMEEAMAEYPWPTDKNDPKSKWQAYDLRSFIVIRDAE